MRHRVIEETRKQFENIFHEIESKLSDTHTVHIEWKSDRNICTPRFHPPLNNNCETNEELKTLTAPASQQQHNAFNTLSSTDDEDEGEDEGEVKVNYISVETSHLFEQRSRDDDDDDEDNDDDDDIGARVALEKSDRLMSETLEMDTEEHGDDESGDKVTSECISTALDPSTHCSSNLETHVERDCMSTPDPMDASSMIFDVKEKDNSTLLQDGCEKGGVVLTDSWMTQHSFNMDTTTTTMSHEEAECESKSDEELLRMKENLSLELLWIGQAITSRKSYLQMKNGMNVNNTNN